MRVSVFGLLLCASCLAPARAGAQTVEVAPIAGYRFGNDVFGLVARTPIDTDGGPVVGAAVNIDAGEQRWFEAMFTRQRATIAVETGLFTPPAHTRVIVDQWLAGGRQEFGLGAARPFMSGVVGLTRAAGPGDSEMRFTAGAGGGVRVPIQRHFGLRADSRVLATILDAAAAGATCGGGTCVALRASVAWQLEFTATA